MDISNTSGGLAQGPAVTKMSPEERMARRIHDLEKHLDDRAIHVRQSVVLGLIRETEFGVSDIPVQAEYLVKYIMGSPARDQRIIDFVHEASLGPWGSNDERRGYLNCLADILNALGVDYIDVPS